MTQDEALNILKTGANVFLTGEPGSGKTHTVNRYVQWLREQGIEPSITASTGIAATHLNGFTIHSWSGIGIKTKMSEWELDRLAQNEHVSRRVRNAIILIIDEISMISAETLDLVEAACRVIRNNDLPFGGLQIILVGDFFQLPPIAKREQYKQDNLLQEPHQTNAARFAFFARTWKQSNLITCYLSEQHRQEDVEFLKLLGAMRANTITSAHHAILIARQKDTAKQGTTQLYSHNADVDAINTIELEKLSTESKLFSMTDRGAEPLVAGLKRGCLSPEQLRLKVGARVMFTKNDPERRFVNGTLGTVVGFVKEGGWPLIKTKAGKTVVAEPMEWHVEDNGRVLAKIIQTPLRLAWAMTVHKSQGMSLDGAHMDLSSAFEYGQGYVALSRVRTLEGLSLAGFNERALLVHPEVHAKDQEFQEQSEAATTIFAKLPPTEMISLHKRFVQACGGTWNTNEGAGHAKNKTRATKKDTRAITLELLREKKDITTIAKERELSIGTIIAHLEELKQTGRITAKDCVHLCNNQKTIITKIHNVFRTLGSAPLKPAFDHFNGTIPYETLRLARLAGEFKSSDTKK